MILLKNSTALLPDGPAAGTDIIVQGGEIARVGAALAAEPGARVIDCTDRFVVPGFVNAHTHASMTLLRSYADDMALMDWLQQKIWPAEEKLDGEDMYWGAMLAIAEMIKSGATTFADMYFFMPDVARAVAETGVRAVLARGMAGVAPNGTRALAESEAFFRDFHGASDGRVTVMLGPHAPYTCPPDYLKKVVALAQKLGARIHTHLSETAGEVATCRQKHGCSPIALMEKLGVLECGVLAAHCVHVSADDIAIMKKYDVKVAHNPGSNMKLASGVAPAPEMLRAGLCVALGTDGASSNNNLDMLEEARLAALLHKVSSGDPLAIPARTAVEMATAAGADALGLGAAVGKIAAGYKADLTLFDMTALEWQPCYDPVSLLIYAANASQVHTVLVDGKILLDGGRLTTIDEARLRYEIQRRAAKIKG